MRDDAKVHGALRVGGELVVAVVGVLIALWVDNANQMRKDRDQELAYVNGILVDLASDSADLVARQRTAERGLEVADRLLALRRDSTARASADSLAVWPSGWIRTTSRPSPAATRWRTCWTPVARSRCFGPTPRSRTRS